MAFKFSRSAIVLILMSIFFRTQKSQPLFNKSLLMGRDGKSYCKFATIEEIRKSEGLVETYCFDNFKNMSQILPNGTKTKPYLKYGAKTGYVPECKRLEIENGTVGSCDPFGGRVSPVHTVCQYSCNPGFIATSLAVTCQLMGPVGNLSVQWWKDKVVVDMESMNSIYCKQVRIQNGKVEVCWIDSKSEPPYMLCNYTCDPDFQQPKSNGTFQFELRNDSFQMDLCLGDPTILESESNTIVIPLAVSFSIVLLIIIVMIALRYTCMSPGSKPRPGIIELNTQETNDTHLVCTCTEEYNGANDSTAQQDASSAESRALLPVAFPELPVDQPYSDCQETCENSKRRVERVNQDKVDNEKVGKKDMEEFEEIMKVIKEPLDDESIVPVNNQTHSDADLMAECTTDVRFLLEDSSSNYRLKLLGELEIIGDRRRDQALVGYIIKNRMALGFPSENSIKLWEENYKGVVGQRVSEHFLKVMSHYGHTIGMMLEYFADVNATNVIQVVLEKHRQCLFCEKFRK